MKMEDMSLTTQHAVWLCRQLGINYLWVDALCILQKPKQGCSEEEEKMEAEDKAREIEKMGIYYSHACLTIAACEENHCDGGLFFLRKPENIKKVPMPYIDCHGRQNGAFFAREELPPFEKTVVHPKATKHDWWYRGWTVQERIMSRRTVYLAKDRIFFECGGHTIAEDEEVINRFEEPYEAYLPLFTQFETSRMSRKSASLQCFPNSPADWYHAMEAFAKCALSVEEDRKSAVQGLANELGKRLRRLKVYEKTLFGSIKPELRYEYLWGIWIFDGHRGLNWQTMTRPRLRNKVNAPSWSWISRTNSEPSIIVWPTSPNIGLAADEQTLHELDIRVMRLESDSVLNLVGFAREIFKCSTPSTGDISDFVKLSYPRHQGVLPKTFLLREKNLQGDGCSCYAKESSGSSCSSQDDSLPVGWAVLDDDGNPNCGRYACLLTCVVPMEVPQEYGLLRQYDRLWNRLGRQVSNVPNLFGNPGAYFTTRDCVTITTAYVLLLEPGLKPGHFRRVGMGQIFRWKWVTDHVEAPHYKRQQLFLE